MTAPAAASSSRPPVRAHRRRRRLGRLVLLAAALVATAYVLRVPLFGALVRGALESALADNLGGVWSIETVGGSWVSDLTVEGVELVTPEPGGALLGASCVRARIEFDPSRVRGDPVGALRSFAADGLRLVVGPGTDSGPSDPAALLDALPAQLPDLDVGGSLEVRTDSGSGSVERFRVVGSGRRLTLRLERLEAPLTARVRGVDLVEGVLERSGRREVTWTSTSEIAGVVLREARFVARDGGVWEADGVLGVLGGAVAWRATGGRLELDAADMDIRGLPALVEQWFEDDIDLPAEGRLSFTAKLATSGDGASTGRTTGKTTLRTTAELRDVRWHDLVASRVEADAVWADGRCEVASATLEHEHGRVVARDVRVDPSAPWAVVAVGGLDVQVDDAAAALRAFDGAGQGGDQGTAQWADQWADQWAERVRRGPLTARLGARLRDGVVEIERIELATPRSRATLSGDARLPARPADWRDAPITADLAAGLDAGELDEALAGRAREDGDRSEGEVRISARISGVLGAPVADGDAAADAATARGHGIERLRAAARLDWPRLRVTRIEVASDLGNVTAGGLVDLEARAVHEGRFAASLPRLAGAGGLFEGAPELEGALTLEGTLDGRLLASADGGTVVDWDGLRAALAAHGEDVAVAGIELGETRFEATARDGTLRAERFEATGPLGSVQAHGAYGLRSGDLRIESLTATVDDVGALGKWLPRAAQLEGAVQVSGSVRKAGDASWKRAEGTAVVSAPRLRRGETTFTGTSISVRAGAGAVELTEALTTTPQLGDVSGAAEFEWREDGIAGRILRLSGRPRGEAVALAAPTVFAWDGERLALEEIDVQGPFGNVLGHVRVGDGLDARLVATGVSLRQFHEQLEGRASAVLQVGGTLAAPAGTLEADVTSFRWRGVEGTARLAVAQDASGWTLERLSIDAGEPLTLSCSGALPFRLTESGIERIADVVPRIRLTARCGRPGPWLELLEEPPLEIAGAELDVVADGPRIEGAFGIVDVRFVGDFAKLPSLPGRTAVRVDAGPDGTRLMLERTAQGLVSLRGNLRTRSVGDWVRLDDLLERMRDAPVAGEVQLETRRLEALTERFEALEYAQGVLRGTLAVGGTVAAPEFSGALVAEELSVRFRGDLPTLDDGAARMRLSGRRIELESFAARLGHGPVRASGWAEFPEDEPLRMDLAVEGENVLLRRTPDLRLRADLGLRVAGPLDGLAVTGRLDVTNALYSGRVAYGNLSSRSEGPPLQLPAVREGPVATARFDIAIRAADTVHVRNNLLRGTLSADLRLRGTGAAPLPEGRVFTHDALVTLPGRRLRIDQGSLSFDAVPAGDPRVDGTLRARLQGYDLQVQASGRLSQPRLFVTANPPLRNDEAVLLLATGARPRDSATGPVAQGGHAAYAPAAGYLSSALAEWFSDPDDTEESYLDRVSIELGKEQSEGDWSTVELLLPIAPGWFLRGERDRYDEFYAGLMRRFTFR